MIDYATALEKALALAGRLASETVALTQASGRISAIEVLAPMDLPGFANAAMDGYALRAGDLAGVSQLPVADTILAGDTRRYRLAPATAMAIMTGAPMPAGADTVVIRENTERMEGCVRIHGDVVSGANVRPGDDDCAAGARVLAAGQSLDAGVIAWLAALGISSVSVVRRPRVAILVTGDELVPAGQPLAFGQRYESNGALLRELALAAGAEVLTVAAVADDPAQLRERLAELAGGADLLLTSGGVSAGDADHLPAAIADLGETVFHKVRIKPGMPVLCGRIAGAVVMALPGNPVSVGVTFLMLVRPLLDKLLGRVAPDGIEASARLSSGWHKRHQRLEFLRVHLWLDADGRLVAEPFRHQGSGALSVLAQSDGLAILAEPAREYLPGDRVRVRGWRLSRRSE